jgi:hypothetical protein
MRSDDKQPIQINSATKSGNSETPRRSDEQHVNPAVKAWLENRLDSTEGFCTGVGDEIFKTGPFPGIRRSYLPPFFSPAARIPATSSGFRARP